MEDGKKGSEVICKQKRGVSVNFLSYYALSHTSSKVLFIIKLLEMLFTISSES